MRPSPASCLAGGGRLRPAVPQSQAHLRHRPQLRRPRQGHRQRRAPRASPAASSRWRTRSLARMTTSCCPSSRRHRRPPRRRNSASSWAATAVTLPEEEWESAIVGYTTILDMTEESILKGNDFVPRQPPLSDHRQELPDVLLLRPPARHARRGARRAQVRGPERP